MESYNITPQDTTCNKQTMNNNTGLKRCPPASLTQDEGDEPVLGISSNNQNKKPRHHPEKKNDDDEDDQQQRQQPRCRQRRQNLFANKILHRTNDDIHSTIQICPVMKCILDSRPLQRLRKVKQLATAEYVYVNCTHNRLEHSLGVSHLAGRLCTHIANRQPVLQCTSKDVLCVKLAGLLHDIGHGPFSHTYEDFLSSILCTGYVNENPELQQYYDQNIPPIPKNYQHETTSLQLIDSILESKGLCINLNQLDEPLSKMEEGNKHNTSSWIEPESLRVYDSSTTSTTSSTGDDNNNNNIMTSRDWIFIKECIWGGPIPEICNTLNFIGFVGRPHQHQEWLYDIVSNSHSGLDVDKIDYFARDSRPAFKGSGEIDKIMIEEAVVAWGSCPSSSSCPRCQIVDNEQKKENTQKIGNDKQQQRQQGRHLMICYPDKVVPAAMNFFKTRHRLHKTIYRHKKTDAVGYMVCDIMKYADPFFRLKIPREESSNTQYTELPISRAMLDVNAFLRLTDSIIDMIANTTDVRLQKARQLIYRLQEGHLYKCVAVKRIDMKNPIHRKLIGLSSSTTQHDEKRLIQEQMIKIGQEMVQAKRSHNNGTIMLIKEDLIIECCSIHCGCGATNPLSRMRFLQKHQMKALDSAISSIHDIPEAHEEDEVNYEADIPRTFEEKSIRVFCRDSSKCELASHVFNEWLVQNTLPKIQTTPPPPAGAFRGDDGASRRHFFENHLVSPGQLF